MREVSPSIPRGSKGWNAYGEKKTEVAKRLGKEHAPNIQEEQFPTAPWANTSRASSPGTRLKGVAAKKRPMLP